MRNRVAIKQTWLVYRQITKLGQVDATSQAAALPKQNACGVQALLLACILPARLSSRSSTVSQEKRR